MSNELRSVTICLLALFVMPLAIQCDEPKPITPTCTQICGEVPIVWTDCDGVRGVHVPAGWAEDNWPYRMERH